MAKINLLALTSVLIAVNGTAYAADMPPPEPLPAAPEVVLPASASGWYLRADLGFSNQEVDELDNPDYATVSDLRQTTGFDGAPFAGVGFGYQFNSWLRMDVTGEYRSSANFHGSDTFSFNSVDGGGAPTGPFTGTDVYTGRKSEITGLVNAYFDLGTWNNITPFVGGGVGVSHNRIMSFTDVGTNTETNATSIAYGRSKGKTNFAWALMAGAGYQVAPGLTLEAAYRYIDLGDAVTGDITTFTGANSRFNPTKFKNLTSHDLKIGMRWALDQPAAPAEPYVVEQPLMRKF